MKFSTLTDPLLRPVRSAIKVMGLREIVLRLSYRRGIPPGLERNALSRIVFEMTGGELKSVSFRQMSGWKKSGAYRLLLRTSTGAKLSLVYKNAHYTSLEIPALAGLPITPGLGEYVFFKRSMSERIDYLPRAFLAEELEDGRHYQYLMEDLTRDYRGLVGPQDRIDLCGILQDMHASFEKISALAVTRTLLRFDRDFVEKLLGYSQKSLEAHRGGPSAPAINALLNDWTDVTAIFRAAADAVNRSEPLILIHGDCNITNAMRHKRTGEFKIIDLEWAGWGFPHQDLVSALKGAPADIEARSLAEFSRRRGEGRLERDTNIYRYCAIQRALLDAGFIGMQMLDAKARTPKWFPDLIDSSCNKALELSRLLKISKI
jgi:hypothetical protein